MIFYTAEEIHWYSKYYSCIPLVFYNKLVAIVANRKVLKSYTLLERVGHSSTGCSSSGTDSSGPGFSLHGPPIGSWPPQRHPSALVWGSSKGCRWIFASPMNLCGLQVHSFFSMVCTTGCRVIPALAPGAPPTPPSPRTLVSEEMTFSRVLILLFYGRNCNCATTKFFFSFLFEYLITEVLPAFLIGPTLASSVSVFGDARVWLCHTWRKLPGAPHRSHPCSPPSASKACSCKPDRQSHDM